MNDCRYFKFEQSTWKFEPGKPPQVKTPHSGGWSESLFTSLEHFLSEPPEAEEITAAEGEIMSWEGS